ncbi:MAG: hypothetical protein B1H08_02410 [Candidatus Omnitrophica bacterium 4484_171]|nr:MAG: hypothetical protein B1H08_02410 [Candidatus Omnitrophica bacterium 4484_171]
MDNWNIEKIKEILPQRPPFLFVDRVLEIDTNESKITCLKNVTINDYFFKGHFPDRPIMPGVIMIEALAQASIILFASLKPEIAAKHPDYLFGKIEAKFSRIVTPGDKLILEVTKGKILNSGGIVNAQALVDNEVAVSARITFGVKQR